MRLESFGISRIRGAINEEAARHILRKGTVAEPKRFATRLKEEFLEKRKKKEEAYRKENREWRPIRKQIEKGQKEIRKAGALVKREAKRIFAAKPYDPHKKERGKVKWDTK